MTYSSVFRSFSRALLHSSLPSFPLSEHVVEVYVFWGQLAKAQAEERRRLGLFRHPLKCLKLFSVFAASGCWSSGVWLISHPITLGLLVPILLGYVVLKLTGKPTPPAKVPALHVRSQRRGVMQQGKLAQESTSLLLMGTISISVFCGCAAQVNARAGI